MPLAATVSPLLAHWAALPEAERKAKLQTVRYTAWGCLGQGAHRLSIALRCAEAGVDGAFEAVEAELDALPTLSLRRLLVALGEREMARQKAAAS